MLWVEFVTATLLFVVLIFCIISASKLSQLKFPMTEFKYASPFAFYFHLFFRLSITALYIVILVIIAIDIGMELFSYYTLWNFILQAIYFVLATLYQITTARSRYAPVRTTLTTHSLNTLFDVCFSTSIIVAIVYWKFIYEPTFNVAWYGYFEHGGNTFAMIIDFFSGHFVISNRNWFFTIFFAVIYSIFIWISYLTWLHRVWPYTFLSMDTPYAPLWYTGIFAGHALSFGIAKVFSIIKERCFPAMLPVAVKQVRPKVHNPITYV